MLELEISLTEQEQGALAEISQRTGKSQAELIRAAVAHLINEFQPEGRRTLMQKAKGIWKDRQDIPDLEDLRHEWNRV
ncbi:MAG: ribbon-helix-helix protein, CopG family [Pyrinomonadaceae bacterium]